MDGAERRRIQSVDRAAGAEVDPTVAAQRTCLMHFSFEQWPVADDTEYLYLASPHLLDSTRSVATRALLFGLFFGSVLS